MAQNPSRKKGKKNRAHGRQFRNQTHDRYNAKVGYKSKSNPRRQGKKWIARKGFVLVATVPAKRREPSCEYQVKFLFRKGA